MRIVEIMALPTLIYCGGGNPTFAEIAINAGFMYGAQLPDDKVYFEPLYFADNNWRKPNRDSYMAALKRYRPHMASVLDLENDDQLLTVLGWAEEAAQYCDVVMIVPKISVIARLPRSIGGKTVILGYSVPTKYGGTPLLVSEFYGWPVHLLGGSPHEQVKLWRYLPNVISVDGNMAMKMATSFCAFYDHTYKNRKHTNWPTLLDADGRRWTGDNGPVEAIRRSFENIKRLWMSVI